MSFYVTLFSNASQNEFPNNTLTHFTTKLKNPIRLEGNYEVALSEIMFPKNWKYREDGIIKCIANGIATFYIRVEFFVYETATQLIQKLKKDFADSPLGLDISYDERFKKKFFYHFQKNQVLVLKMTLIKFLDLMIKNFLEIL